MAISMLKIRRPLGRLIFSMGIAIPGKTVFLIETAPRKCGIGDTHQIFDLWLLIIWIQDLICFIYYSILLGAGLGSVF